MQAKLHPACTITCLLKGEKQLKRCWRQLLVPSLTCYVNMSVPGTVNVKISKEHAADREQISTKTAQNDNPLLRTLVQLRQIHLN